jgi:DNA-binding beta-propeller fold protein YncE
MSVLAMRRSAAMALVLAAALPAGAAEEEALTLLGRYSSGIFGASAAEITAYDPTTRRAFVVNAKAGAVDVLDIADPANPRRIGEINANDVAPNATVNSLAVRNGLIALAVEPAVKTDPGFAAFYQVSDFKLLGKVQVGALPDMLTFTPDGKTVLVANEGEPADDYAADPEGSISIIDISNPASPTARTADFRAWNGKEAELRAQGARITSPGASVAQDFEPEYIAVSEDGKTAWVALQENNALARVDIATARVTLVQGLGVKDHGAPGNGLDTSDTDKAATIKTWAGVKGFYMPDSIAAYTAGGKTYIVTANEGDSRPWGEGNKAYWNFNRGDDKAWKGGDAKGAPGFVEEFRVKHLVNPKGFDARAGEDLPPQLRALAKGAMLSPQVFGYCGATADGPGDCAKDEALGRLTISWGQGYQTNADGTPKLSADGKLVYDTLYAYGARSFSIRDENGGLVWDSGDAFETRLAALNPKWFNSTHDKNAVDDRSDNKGPEPEGLALGQIGDKTYAFIGLERIGGVMVYDITDPRAPRFAGYTNSRDFDADPKKDLAKAGDLGPEGLTFVAAKDSPTGQPLLIVGNEVSGTTALYRITVK